MILLLTLKALTIAYVDFSQEVRATCVRQQAGATPTTFNKLNTTKHTHIHSHTPSHTLTHTRTHTHTLSLTHSHTPSHTHSYTPSHTYSLSFSFCSLASGNCVLHAPPTAPRVQSGVWCVFTGRNVRAWHCITQHVLCCWAAAGAGETKRVRQ